MIDTVFGIKVNRLLPYRCISSPAACMHRLTEAHTHIHTPVTCLAVELCVSCRVQQSSISNRFDAKIINYKRKNQL